MADKCVSLVRGRTIRATELDACGAVVEVSAGLPSHGVSTGFVSVAFANEIDEGDEINQKNANGDICVLVPPKQVIKWINVTAVFCKIDPWLFTVITRQPLVLNEDGDAIGFRQTRVIEQERGVALETWTGTKEDAVCSGPLPQFGYFLLPYLTSALITDFTIENAAINLTIVGKNLAGGAWGVGPYDIDIDGTPAALVPLADTISADDLWHFQVVTLPPPGAVCGQYPGGVLFTVAAANPPVTHGVELVNTGGTYAQPHTIDWGDGTTSAGLLVLVTEQAHTYPAAGTYIVTVTDDTTGATTYEVVTVT